MNHGVLQLSAHLLDLTDVDVLNRVPVPIQLEIPTGNILDLHLSQGFHELGSVLHIAVNGLDGLHDPSRSRVGSLGVVRASLLGLLTEGSYEFLVCRIVQGLTVMERRNDSDRLITHGGEGMFVRGRSATNRTSFPLRPNS